jgi:hypothetical protein
LYDLAVLVPRTIVSFRERCLGWERNWPPSFYDPLFMPPYYRGLRPFWFDFPSSLERESALVDFRMHSKGYRLKALPY